MAQSSYPPLARPLFLTTRKSTSPIDMDCHYCHLKQKFSGPGVRCVQHTITDNRSSLSRSDSCASSQSAADHIVGLLNEAEEALEDYWNNLYQHSHGNSKKAKSQLNDIHNAFKSLQEVLAKFPPADMPSSPQTQTKMPQEERKLETRSQKFITSNFSELFEDASPGEQIKEWVLYMQRILVTRQIREQQLPLQEEIDMRIFKESMQRKFLTFAKGYQKYQQRTADALQRLLFYMQKFGGQISQEQFSRDLRFLEQTQEKSGGQSGQELHRFIFMQAITIQHLLAQKQLEMEELLASPSRLCDNSRTRSAYDFDP